MSENICELSKLTNQKENSDDSNVWATLDKQKKIEISNIVANEKNTINKKDQFFNISGKYSFTK